MISSTVLQIRTRVNSAVRGTHARSFWRFLFLFCSSFGVSSCAFFQDILGNLDTTPTNCESSEFIVTQGSDVITGACNEQCSLRDAIIAANNCPGPDIVTLPDYDYVLSLRGSIRSGEDRDPVTGEDANWGDLDILEDLTINGISGTSFISGESTWQHRILHIDEDATVNLNKVGLSGGNFRDGGSIRNHGTLLIDNSVFQENRATSGGGIQNLGEAVITRSEFRHNTVTHRGGAIENYSQLDISNTLFESNRSTIRFEGCGGAIHNVGQQIISNSIFIGNRSSVGGAICQDRGSATSSVSRSRFESNDVGGGFGGAIYLWDSSYLFGLDDPKGLLVDRSRFIDNSGYRGGAISIDYQGVEITNSLFSNNRHPRSYWENSVGGAIHMGRRSHLLLKQSAFINNIADYGGAINFSRGDIPVGASDPAVNEIENVTFSGNRSFTNGGAIFTTARLDVNWSTFFDNLGATGHDIYTSRDSLSREPYPGVTFGNNIFAGRAGFICLLGGLGITSTGNNVIESTIGCSRAARGDQIGVRAGLVLPIDNSEALPIYRLETDSIARGSGNNTVCPAVDQLGNPRPESGGDDCDSGAYEAQE